MKNKAKCKLVVDNQKELMIKKQLADYSDTVHPMCAFPPPTKKALSWREVGGFEQLFLCICPTFPLFASTVAGGETTGDVSSRRPGGEPSTYDLDVGMGDDLRPFDLDGPELGDGNLDTANQVISEMPNLEGESGKMSGTQSTEERQSNELLEEFEQQ